MKNYKRILSAIMSMAMIFSLVGCNGENTDKGEIAETSSEVEETVAETEETGQETGESSTTDTATETILATDYFDSTPIDDMNAVVMTINGRDITVQEYRYYFLNVKSQLDSGDESLWNGVSSTSQDGTVISAEDDIKSKLQVLKSQTDTYLKNNYTVEVMAENNSVKLDDEDIKEAEEEYNLEVEAFKLAENSDDAGWTDYLAQMYCTPELYKMALQRKGIEYKLIRTLYEDDFTENVLVDYVMAKHILLGTTDVDYEAVEIPEGATEEEIADINAQNDKLREEAKTKLMEEKLKLAEEIAEKAKSGEDFDKLIKEYNEDPGEVAKEDGTYDGYLFTKGEMVEQFETAAFALEVGAVSDVVETNYGYHIIKRVEVSEDYLDDNIVDIMMTNETYYQKYSTVAQEVSGNLEIEYTDIYDKINVLSLT